MELGLKYVRDPDVAGKLEALQIHDMVMSLLEKGAKLYVKTMISYITFDGEKSEINNRAEQMAKLLPELREDIMTLRESLITQGEQKGLQKGRQEGLQEGLQEGETKRNRAIAITMLKNAEPMDKVADYTDLSMSELEKLQNRLHN